jgi:hypothetical protein
MVSSSKFSEPELCHVFLIITMFATCPVHLILLALITLTTLINDIH